MTFSMKHKMPANVLRSLLRYDPDTGKLFWLRRDQEAESKWKAWNAKFAGKEALYGLNDMGYRQGSVLRHRYLAHRVIWVMVHGKWPDGEIDHINGDRSDNRLDNLREVTRSENSKNLKRPKNNKSGIVGVHWHKQTGTWKAVIYSSNKQFCLGYFKRKADAAKARADAESRHGFHNNHGRAA